MTSRASPRLRLFAALELPNAIARALGQAIANLRAAAPHHSVRWVRSEGIHLTLKFFGEVAAGRLPE
ncbi:MAG: 2'-5' RNA ligase family protein, partial [Anaerolineales bacterium]